MAKRINNMNELAKALQPALTVQGLSVSHKPHVWDDTMDNTINNGSLLKSAVAYLKSRGFSVNVK